MKRKHFLLGLFFILLIGFFFHLYPLIHNLFYFTMDQGRDAVHVRELLTRGKLLPVGPETSIPGVYHGALWFYFIAIGYALFGGSPAGAVVMMILLHQATLAYLMWTIQKRVSPAAALVVGLSLQLFWIFYETSSYAFNPFALVPLSIIGTLLLIEAWEATPKKYVLAAAIVGLSFHSHILGAISLLLWYTAVTLIFLIKHKLHLSHVLKAAGILFLFSIPHLWHELTHNFSQWHALANSLSEQSGFFKSTNVPATASAFIQIFAQSIFPYGTVIGIIVGIALIAWYVWHRVGKKRKNTWFDRWILLSVLLFIISLIFFLPNESWRSWVTLYLYPLLFVSAIGIILTLPRLVSVVLLLCIVGSQGYYFIQRYKGISIHDPSMLANELKAIDWVYEKAQGEGFDEYSYLPSVLDYPYQYLFWWHGRKNYGYIPCEYASFPGSPKLFIPGKKYYETPTRDCSGLTFLIVEPNLKNPSLRNDWLSQIRGLSTHKESTEIGTILVEMREKNK